MWKLALAALLLPGPDDLAHPDPARRLKALETVHRANDPARLPALLPLLGDPELRLRLRAAEALRTHPELLARAFRLPNPLARLHACRVAGPPLAAALEERLSDPDARVRAEAARSLSAPAAIPKLLERAARDPDPHVRALALEAAGKIDPARVAPALDAAIRDSQGPVRQIAAERAAALGRPDLLERLLSDRDWRVRSAALASLPKTREAVGWLVDRVGEEEGRMEEELLARLRDLAGRDLGPHPRPWKDWWAAVRHSFTPGSNGAAATAPATRTSFFDLPLSSLRIMFVIDLSGSMREPAPGGTGTKLDAAKQGLLETIRTLPADARFGIVGLGCAEDGSWPDREKKCWGGRPLLRPASPAAKADASRFVEALEARGWTNLYDGLEWALSDPDVDTICLYSDGGASKGAVVASAEILEELRRRNRFLRVRVDCVEVPSERNPADNRRLLASIAAATGGRSRLVPR